jgi:hypothetical protein
LGPDLIAVLGAECKSWPVYRWHGLHISPEKHGQPGVQSAKFVVAMDDEYGGGLAYGRYIESAGADAERFVHWRNFRDGLAGGEA